MTIKEKLDKKQTELGKVSLYKNRTDAQLLEIFLEATIEENQGRLYEIYGQLEERGINTYARYRCMVLFCIDELNLVLFQKNEFDVVSRNLMLCKLCQDYGKERKIPVTYNNYSSVQMLFESSDKEKLKDSIKKHCNEITKRAKEKGLPHILIVTGEICEDLFETAVSRVAAHEGIALTLKEKKDFYSYEDYSKERDFLNCLADASEKIYRDYLMAEIEHMEKHIDEFYNCIPGKDSAEKSLRAGSYLIYFICNRANVKTHYRKAAYGRLMQEVDEKIKEGKFSRGSITQILIDMMKEIMSRGKVVRLSETNQLVDQAKKYIFVHFAEPISLVTIAEELGVNSCYLSDLFHRHLGEPYSKYLLKVRMERAAQLLKKHPDAKVYEVAERVGFVSAKHFISTFKKYYGVTPSVFAESR